MSSTQTLLAMSALMAAHWAQAATLVDLQFETDAADLAAITAGYGLTASGAFKGASVSEGELKLVANGNNKSMDFGSFAGDVSISFDASIADPAAAGGINVGLRVGDHNIVFHPGYASGAFRIDGVIGNTDMGFTPNVAVLNHFRVDVDADARTFAISITDGADPGNVWNYLFEYAGYAPGQSTFGLSTGGGPYGARFDNLLVTTPPVPEPGTWMLLAGGLAALGLVRRRQAHS